jgi:hypothetical protein
VKLLKGKRLRPVLRLCLESALVLNAEYKFVEDGQSVAFIDTCLNGIWDQDVFATKFSILSGY